jgi:thioredoxin reductase (NADPH)
MQQPIIFLIVHEESVLKALHRDINKRFGTDYTIYSEQDPLSALNRLQTMATEPEPVALLIADQRMPEMSGVDFLVKAHKLHPSSKRILLVERDYTRANPAFRQ